VIQFLYIDRRRGLHFLAGCFLHQSRGSFMDSLVFMEFYGLSHLVYGFSQFQRMQTASADERWSVRELGRKYKLNWECLHSL
jgi:hypothetical protein